MKLISILAVLFSAPALAIPGTLEVSSGSFRVKRNDGMKVNFYAGKYKSEMSWNRGTLYLMVERKEVRTDAELALPGGYAIPENGAFELDGFRTGQTFSVKGTISTNRQKTELEREQESCVWYRQEWICHGWGPHHQCGWESIPVQGWRPVEYYFETKTVSVDLALDSRNGGDSRWKGQETERRKIYTFQGPCH